MLAIDPSQTEAVALLWVAVLTVIASAALGGVIRIWPQIAQLYRLWQELGQHSAAIEANTRAISDLKGKVEKVEGAVQPMKGGTQ